MIAFDVFLLRFVWGVDKRRALSKWLSKWLGEWLGERPNA
jgi:hypothetical protein